jgi:thiosulfate/3-mercaptopyruvate sulfurtransferase
MNRAYILLLAGAITPVGPSSANDGPLAKGKALYDTYCARCHGDDGADVTTYVGAKSLVNVTARLSRTEVIEKSRGFAAVQLEGEPAAALYTFLTTFQKAEYPNAALLVETEWLAAHHGDPHVRVVDVRSEAAYNAGHVPNAVRLDDRALRSADDKETYLPTPQALAEMMGKAGISNKTRVIVYDDSGGRSAARVWYVLNAYGHDNVSLVNGGWPKWAVEKRASSTQPTLIQPTVFTPKLVPTLSCPSSEVLARKPGVVVLDTRSDAEHKAGRIPGAVNLDWKDNVTGAEMVFKPSAELLKMFEAKGVTKDKEIVTHCASGGRAAQSLFTLKLLGYPKVRVYYGSFSDYTTRPNAPVEK